MPPAPARQKAQDEQVAKGEAGDSLGPRRRPWTPRVPLSYWQRGDLRVWLADTMRAAVHGEEPLDHVRELGGKKLVHTQQLEKRRGRRSASARALRLRGR